MWGGNDALSVGERYLGLTFYTAVIRCSRPISTFTPKYFQGDPRSHEVGTCVAKPRASLIIRPQEPIAANSLGRSCEGKILQRGRGLVLCEWEGQEIRKERAVVHRSDCSRRYSFSSSAT